jgi:hypothetical protein
MSNQTELTINQKIAISRITADVVISDIQSTRTATNIDDFTVLFDYVYSHVCKKIVEDVSTTTISQSDSI